MTTDNRSVILLMFLVTSPTNTVASHEQLEVTVSHGPDVAIVVIHYVSGFQDFLSATQIWVWWTPRDPSRKQHMKTLMIVYWMIFGNKLLRSFLVPETYSFLKHLHYRHTQTSSGSVVYDPKRGRLKLPWNHSSRLLFLQEMYQLAEFLLVQWTSLYCRIGELIPSHGPHELWIIAGEPQNQLISS